jgi:type I restriction enzyme S subunit
VLSAYDRLIENNDRRIALLEDLAALIYREWFVEYRYPGHELAELVSSASGPIPEGWSVGRVGDHVEVMRGRSYRSVDLAREGGVPFINLKCIARDGGFRFDGIKRFVGQFKDANVVTKGDVVMAVTDMTPERRVVARAARVPDLGEAVGVFSMDLVKLVPREFPREFILAALRYSRFPDEVKGYANGANVLHLHVDRIADYLLVFPPPSLASAYADIIAPLQRLADELHSASECLREARDLLLPRLISGESDLSVVEVTVPRGAQ